MNTLDRIMEAKQIIRHVRTPQGAEHYGQPIGSVIVPDVFPNSQDRRKGRRGQIAHTPNTPHRVAVPAALTNAQHVLAQMGRPPATRAPEGVTELPEEEGARKFRIGRKVFRSFMDEDGIWTLTNAKWEVLHEGGSEREAMRHLGSLVSEEQAAKARRDQKKIENTPVEKVPNTPVTAVDSKGRQARGSLQFRPATDVEVQKIKEVHGFQVPPRYAHTAQVQDVPEFWKHDPFVRWTDDKGKAQTRYSAAYRQKKDREKFERIAKMNAHMEQFDQWARDNWRTNEQAAVLLVAQQTGMRPSSDGNNTQSGSMSYGFTTLEARHISFPKKGQVRVKFPGKHGVDQDHIYTDPDLIAMFRSYTDGKPPTGQVFPLTTDKHMNVVVKQIIPGVDYVTMKDFRTHLATSLAVEMLARKPKPKTAKELTALKKEISTEVSGVLGNEPTEALKSYIAPSVWSTTSDTKE